MGGCPAGYLTCNNSTYNISTYPDLADYFLVNFGSKNYFGGNGTTTFKVPDLRGEFLRGTGTNGHSDQGGGANVGVHQDATYHLFNRSSSGWLYNGEHTGFKNADSQFTNGQGRAYIQGTNQTAESTSVYTARPTNTSVLYCIKY